MIERFVDYLLTSRFPELHAIRVAYQLYEELDTKGMPLDERLLQRAIKVCE